jgi:dephospho-CoA kinase
VHALLRDDQDVRAALVERFGPEVIDAGGAVDRAAIADIVFKDREALEWLEALLHPRVVQEYLIWRERLAERPQPPALCVTEVPLLYESGGESRFDFVVVITAPADVRSERTHVRDDDREQRLIPDDEKVQRADFAYVNDGTLEELDAFVADVVARLSR